MPVSALRCEHGLARLFERELRMRLYYHDHFRDDTVIEREWIVRQGDPPQRMGLEPRTAERLGAGAWGFDPVILEPADLGKLRFPEISHDEAETERQLEIAGSSSATSSRSAQGHRPPLLPPDERVHLAARPRAGHARHVRDPGDAPPGDALLHRGAPADRRAVPRAGPPLAEQRRRPTTAPAGSATPTSCPSADCDPGSCVPATCGPRPRPRRWPWSRREMHEEFILQLREAPARALRPHRLRLLRGSDAESSTTCSRCPTSPHLDLALRRRGAVRREAGEPCHLLLEAAAGAPGRRASTPTGSATTSDAPLEVARAQRLRRSR